MLDFYVTRKKNVELLKTLGNEETENNELKDELKVSIEQHLSYLMNSDPNSGIVTVEEIYFDNESNTVQLFITDNSTDTTFRMFIMMDEVMKDGPYLTPDFKELSDTEKIASLNDKIASIPENAPEDYFTEEEKYIMQISRYASVMTTLVDKVLTLPVL